MKPKSGNTCSARNPSALCPRQLLRPPITPFPPVKNLSVCSVCSVGQSSALRPDMGWKAHATWHGLSSPWVWDGPPPTVHSVPSYQKFFRVFRVFRGPTLLLRRLSSAFGHRIDQFSVIVCELFGASDAFGMCLGPPTVLTLESRLPASSVPH